MDSITTLLYGFSLPRFSASHFERHREVFFSYNGCLVHNDRLRAAAGNRRAEEIQTIHTYVAAAVETDAGGRFPTDETKDSLPPFPRTSRDESIRGRRRNSR